MVKVIDTFKEYYAKDRAAWRKWLEKNHNKEEGIWLIYYKSGSDKTRIAYPEAVKEAICFGWIDSTIRPIDDEKYKQLFMPRKEKSGWSQLNKQYVEELTELGLMTEAGIEKIEQAKHHGTWSKLDHIETFTVPEDLEKELKKSKTAQQYFEGLGKTNKKYLLHWLSTAKKEETRNVRIDTIVSALKEQRMPDRYIRKPKK
ncbi:MAG: YdeI/OmpD-associated family protein [Bacteroidetes bacterium]|nr:YdeI/OmpD-associated family protein [Bacteroidota bacterium]